MRMLSLCVGFKVTRKQSWNTQEGILITCMDISWSLIISCSISTYGYKSINCSCFASILCGV